MRVVCLSFSQNSLLSVDTMMTHYNFFIFCKDEDEKKNLVHIIYCPPLHAKLANLIPGTRYDLGKNDEGNYLNSACAEHFCRHFRSERCKGEK